MHHASHMSLFNSCAENEYVNYVMPQEHGNHYNTRMLKIGNMCFEGESFEFNVSEYSTHTLTTAMHTDELEKDGFIHLRVDYKVSGIGSNSCGPNLEEEFRLNENNIDFKFSMYPIE